MPFKYCCCVKVLDNFPRRILYLRTILFLLGLLTFPLSILILNIYTCCKFNLCCCHYEFWDKHFWCRSRVLEVEKFSPDITELTKRYMKKPPVKSYEMLKKFIIENRRINRMLVAANDGLPNHFFHVELSGSLAERFGKPLPSNSNLASDYDLMLVPSRLTVYIENQSTKKTSELLTARKDLSERQKEDEPFYWIELPQNTHYYLQDTCLQYYKIDSSRKAKNSNIGKELCYLISSATIKPTLKKEIDKVVRMEPRKNYMKATIKGPAVNVKCKKNKESKKILLDVDMTLALPCFHWPDNAMPWFDREHRWIGAKKKYDYKTRLKKVGLHMVPKQSLNFTEEILLHKPQMKTENKTKYPCLEWRLSFSLPELVLSQHVPEIVRWAFMILKSTIKRRQKPFEMNKMPSYFLKNTLFWYMDDLKLQECIDLHNVELPKSRNFNKDIFEEKMWFVIDGLIKKLSKFIGEKNVPHYWWNGNKYNLVTCDAETINLDCVQELLDMLQTDDKNLKLLMMSHLEADLEMAEKTLIKSRRCCYKRKHCYNAKVEKKKEIDKHFELEKFIYTGKSKESIFHVFNCLPCGECDCKSVEFCHAKDDKLSFHEY